MAHDRPIRLADTDAAGVVYFASLLSICHEAYESSLGAAGIDLKDFFSGRGFAIPIVGAEINFFKPLYCGDRLSIDFSFHSLNDSEFALDYRLYCQDNLVGTARTRHVCIDPNSRERLELPVSIIDWAKNL